MSEGLDIRAIKADIERAQESLDELRNMVDSIYDGFIYLAARQSAWDLEQTARRLRDRLRMKRNDNASD